MKTQSDIFPPRTELPIPEQMLIALRRITQSMDLHSRYLVKHHGLTGPQLIILREIQRKGEGTVGDLARAISLSQSTVTGILDRLEARGLVERRRADEDKRRVIVGLTDECHRFLENAPSIWRKDFLRGFEEIPHWEQLMILTALQRLTSLMKADAIEAGAFLNGGRSEEAAAPASIPGGVSEDEGVPPGNGAA
ncbi:MAG: MarR family winged helix-turn-helix transcriptional regulator [Desulfococcaceae bacterium]